MKHIDTLHSYNTARLSQSGGLITAIRSLMPDQNTIVEDEQGNLVAAVKLFEETLSDGSKLPHLVLYFDAELKEKP